MSKHWAPRGLFRRGRLAWCGTLMGLLCPMLASAQKTLLWTTNYYTITGATLGEIRQSLRQSRPRKDTPGVDGLTEWRINWRYKATPLNGGCRCSSFSTTTTITTTLPRWKVPTNAPPEVKKACAHYLTALGQHEAGHAQLALAAVAEQHQRIQELGEEPDCDALKKKVNELAGQIVEDYRKRDKEYDQSTEHGAKQGAVLPASGRRDDRKRE